MDQALSVQVSQSARQGGRDSENLVDVQSPSAREF
jgi:hypothetical protein